MQVDNYVDGKQAPMFLLWGKDDDLVKFKPTKMLENAIKRRGGSVVVKKYDGIDHVNMIGVFSKLRDDLAPIVSDIDEWMKKIMQ
jgi:dipeptidyl aminopeptidase/acylaminoacyl peptidase